MKNNLSCWLEEEELKEGVQDLLNHFIILLFGAQ
jgi:hypothetical protein